ncbi:MAG: Ig-like domain-containing protein [Calditrichaceae bacterium]
MNMRKFYLSLGAIIVLIFIGCDTIGDIIDPYNAPVISDEGILLSAGNLMIGDTLTASVSATNPETGPLTYQWTSADGGMFIQPSDSSRVRWVAPLKGDVYTIRVKVANENKNAEASRDVNVISPENPIVNILSPKSGSYIVQYDSITVKASVVHDNPLAAVRLFVDDSLLMEQSYRPDNTYSMRFKSNAGMIGQTKIKIEAEAGNQLANLGSDSVFVFIEAIIQGKAGIN